MNKNLGGLCKTICPNYSLAIVEAKKSCFSGRNKEGSFIQAAYLFMFRTPWRVIASSLKLFRHLYANQEFKMYNPNGVVRLGGTIHSRISSVVGAYDKYRKYMRSEIDLDEYYSSLLLDEDFLISQGLTENQVHLTTRFPRDDELFVDEFLSLLHRRHLIQCVDYDKDDFRHYREIVRREFFHGGYETFIFPEEERLMYALSQILKPRSVILLGSYYGYWGIWLMPVIKKLGGIAFFVDIDDKVADVCLENMSRFGYLSVSKVVTDDAVVFMREQRQRYDFAVLDAETPWDHPDPTMRGKAIYYPLALECKAHMTSDAALIAHNILLSNKLDDPHFNGQIARNEVSFREFLPFMAREFSRSAIAHSSEGVGVYRI